MSEVGVDSLILGHRGQDGILLREQLQAKGMSWIGVSRSRADGSEGTEPRWYDVGDRQAVADAVVEWKPRRIFYLAAAHGGSSATGPAEIGAAYRRELEVNTLGVIHHLEALQERSPETRFVFASSSLVFAPTGDPADRISEQSALAPSEPYGLQKALAGMACRDFRERHGLFASVAYLFNHESVHRREGYFSSQIVSDLRQLSAGEADHLEVGNLNAIVDWSFAGDVVDALQRIAETAAPQDFVVASGVGRTVAEFLSVAFDEVGLDMDSSIKVNPALLRRTNSCRVGDASRLRRETGWAPTLGFEEMVRHLVRDRA